MREEKHIVKINDRNSSAQAPVFRHGDKPLVCYNKKIVGASTIGGELVRPEESGKFEDTRIPRLQSCGVCQCAKIFNDFIHHDEGK